MRDFTLSLEEKQNMLLEDEDRVKMTLLNQQIQLHKKINQVEDFVAEHSSIALKMSQTDWCLSRDKILSLYRDRIERVILNDKLWMRQNGQWRARLVQEEKKRGMGVRARVQMSTLQELSLERNNFLLVEYLQEKPYLLGMKGMHSRIDNYV